MKEIKIIFTSEEPIKDKILEINSLQEKYKEDWFVIYEWFRELYKDEENIVLVYFNDFSSSLKYIKENYDIFKIIVASIWIKTWNLDIKSWDVIIPNTFISKKEENPIFVEYLVWENYDLTKFWLVLSWLCISWEVNNEDTFDISEDNIYEILSKIKEVDLLNKTTAVMWISFEKDDDVYNNTVNIIELVL